jgi:hypothetical protein
MGVATKFDLGRLIDDELDGNQEANPHRLVDFVEKQIPDEHLREALRECLHHEITRRLALRSLRRAVPARVTPLGTSTDQTSTASHASDVSGRTKAPPPTSRRWSDAAAWHQAVLKERICVEPGVWKYFGDCTKAEVLRAAQMRRDHAGRVLARADQLERVASAMNDNDAVSKLPADLLRELMS